MTYDVIVIGGGAVGCATARELSRYHLSTAVLEKNSDVAGETTGRNSAVVHAGFNNRPGSLAAQLCVEGNRGFARLCRELDVPFRRTGKLLTAFDEEGVRSLEELMENGRASGCRGLSLVDGETGQRLLRQGGRDADHVKTGGAAADTADAGNVKAGSAASVTSAGRNSAGAAASAPSSGEHSSGGWLKALYSPQTGITNPFLYCVALAENALANGVKFFLETTVTGISSGPGGFRLQTSRGAFSCRVLVNSAGLCADRIAAMAGVKDYRIYPCRGEYFILDKTPLSMPVYPAPRKGEGGLGVHITPTIEGSVLLGPSAEYLDSRSDYACTRPVMDRLREQAGQLLPALREARPIGNYSGIRPKLTPPQEGGCHDFVIRREEAVPGLIDLVGIESPGLTASAPIGRKVAAMAREILAERYGREAPEKRDFIARRRGILRFREQTPEVQSRLVREDPEYGQLFCRCQHITKREIREAIENPLGARTVAAVKYRAWATTGRCAGGFCLPRIAALMIREYGMKPEEIRYRERGSELFTGRVK
ncbi:MAG: NAD(P)/FAD-dependent oxidoreductase [Anaerovoracaceae bacterium]|jgi:glycerol-3-phosphate dehydrogenase